MKSLLKHLFSLAALSFVVATLHAEPALLGNAALKGQTLDAEGTKAVLLGKRVTIGDARVVVVIAKSSAAQDSFLQAHLAMTTSQFQNHWRRLFMTGGGSAPKIVGTESEACKLAAETPGAVVIADTGAAAGLTVLGQ